MGVLAPLVLRENTKHQLDRGSIKGKEEPLEKYLISRINLLTIILTFDWLVEIG